MIGYNKGAPKIGTGLRAYWLDYKTTQVEIVMNRSKTGHW